MKQLLWLKFYPKDWNGDHNLRACSLAARGLLASFLEPMHTADPYGHLLVRGKKPDYAELAVVASCKVREVKYGVEELVKNGVLSTTDAGILFSRRMVRDAERAKKRSKDGGKGGNPSLTPLEPIHVVQRVTRTEVNHQVNHQVKPIESRGQKPEAKTRTATDSAENVPSRVREFLTWFQSEYKARRHGATYFVKWEVHGKLVKDLLRVFDFERLKKLAIILLTTDEEWTSETDRGIGILSTRINWLEEKLCAWEAKRKAREAV